MKAADLSPQRDANRLITWVHNDTTFRSRPFAIEHSHGFTYLHIEGYRAHELRAEWEVVVTP